MTMTLLIGASSPNQEQKSPWPLRCQQSLEKLTSSAYFPPVLNKWWWPFSNSHTHLRKDMTPIEALSLVDDLLFYFNAHIRNSGPSQTWEIKDNYLEFSSTGALKRAKNADYENERVLTQNEVDLLLKLRQQLQKEITKKEQRLFSDKMSQQEAAAFERLLYELAGGPRELESLSPSPKGQWLYTWSKRHGGFKKFHGDLILFLESGLLRDNLSGDSLIDTWWWHSTQKIPAKNSKGFAAEEMGEHGYRLLSWPKLAGKNEADLGSVHLARKFDSKGQPLSLEAFVNSGGKWIPLYFVREGQFWKRKTQIAGESIESVCIKCHRSMGSGFVPKGLMTPKPQVMNTEESWWRAGLTDKKVIEELLKF